MTSIFQAASYIKSEYQQIFACDSIDILKLNKLLYFVKREGYMEDDTPVFIGGFHAGPYGPVVVDLKYKLSHGELHDMPSEDWVEKYRDMIDEVIRYYGGKSSISLSILSHDEISWKNARDRTKSKDRYEPISEEDIRRDAMKIRHRIEHIGFDSMKR